jgi:hypothetical protein
MNLHLLGNPNWPKIQCLALEMGKAVRANNLEEAAKIAESIRELGKCHQGKEQQVA